MKTYYVTVDSGTDMSDLGPTEVVRKLSSRGVRIYCCQPPEYFSAPPREVVRLTTALSRKWVTAHPGVVRVRTTDSASADYVVGVC